MLTKWQRVISGSGPITHEIQKGWSKDQVKKDEKEVVEQFNVSTETGFSFAGAYARTKLSNSLSVRIFNSVETSLHQSIITTDTAVCPNPDNQLVALYQWTLNSSGDGNDVFV